MKAFYMALLQWLLRSTLLLALVLVMIWLVKLLLKEAGYG